MNKISCFVTECHSLSLTITVVFTTKEKQFLFSNYCIRNAVEEQTYLFLMIDGRDWRLLEELALQMQHGAKILKKCINFFMEFLQCLGIYQRCLEERALQLLK